MDFKVFDVALTVGAEGVAKVCELTEPFIFTSENWVQFGKLTPQPAVPLPCAMP